VFRSKLNLRWRHLLRTNKTAAEATTANDTNCCQSMEGTYPQTRLAQQMIRPGIAVFLALHLTKCGNPRRPSGGICLLPREARWFIFGGGVRPNAQLAGRAARLELGQIVATKDHRRVARGLIEALECRVHVGPPIHEAEVRSAREFLCQNAFSVASDYFQRLEQIKSRLETRTVTRPLLAGKRNYGGEAAGRWMQLQSAYDHVILSTCYDGVFACKQGRVKISHRFNQAGRVDFVELKFLRSLQPCLDGELRKLLRVKDYQTLRKDWHAAEAFILPVLPQELVFLYQDIFRSPRTEVLAWLVNIGHGLAGDLLEDVRARPANGSVPHRGNNGDQLSLPAIRSDEVAMPILEHAVSLECAVELCTSQTARVRYLSRV